MYPKARSNSGDLDIVGSLPRRLRRYGARGGPSWTNATSALTLPAPAADAAPPPPPGADTAARHLAALTVDAEGSDDDYDRDKFPHWTDQGDNCNTREVVLKRDGKNVQTGSDCYPTSGSWTSPFDSATWTKPSDVDIDHIVPLSQSWVSGAKHWTQERRQEFANDLIRPQLLAVTDNVNQEKSDQAPDEWKLPRTSYWCTYATNWITVKHHYQLTITSAEKSSLEEMLGRC